MFSGSHRLSFSLEAHEPAFFLGVEYDKRDNVKGEKKVEKKKKKNPYCRLVKRARSSLGRFVKYFRSNMSKLPQQSVPADRGRRTPSRHSVSNRCEEFGNSHQSEAIEDCINFLKNSSRKEVSTPIDNFSTCHITSSYSSSPNNYYTCNSDL